MEGNLEINREPELAKTGAELAKTEPKFTRRWLGRKIFFVIGTAFVLALVACGICCLASGRVSEELLPLANYNLILQSIMYCFPVLTITLSSLILIEIAFRKRISNYQYALIGMALTLFYLLLLAITEKVTFGWAYTIVTVMTIGLIVLFVKGLTKNKKATAITAGILIAEYLLMYTLIMLGVKALLFGSILLFLIIGLAMYLTLRLKVENEELILK